MLFRLRHPDFVSLRSGLIVLLLLTLAACENSPDLQSVVPPTTLKIQSAVPEEFVIDGLLAGHFRQGLADRRAALDDAPELIDFLYEKSAVFHDQKPVVAVQWYQRGDIVATSDLFAAVGRGEIDGAWYPASLAVRYNLAFALLAGAPFGLDSEGYRRWAKSERGAALRDALYQKFNIKALLCGGGGPAGGGWFARKIDWEADFDGLALRMVGPMSLVVARLGADPVAAGARKSLRLLAGGRIDGVEFGTPYHDWLIGAHEAGAVYYYPGWRFHGGTELIINLDRWRGLDENSRDGLAAQCKETYEYSIAEDQRWRDDALAEFVADGISVETVPPGAREVMKAAWEQVVREQSAIDPEFGQIWRSMMDFADQERAQ